MKKNSIECSKNQPLVLLSLLVIGLVFNKPCNTRYRETTKRYPLYMTIDTSDNIKSDAKVLLNGKEIGAVREITRAGDKKVLDMGIYKDVEIPSGAFVAYFESLMGVSYISFTHPEKSLILNTIAPNDTVHMPLQNSTKLDSSSARVLVNIIHDVIKVVDSNLKKEKAGAHE